MNTRALYYLGKLVLHVAWLVYAAILMASLRISDSDDPFLHLFALGLALWAGWRMNSALDRLKAEANRDTSMGLNGPARKEDLLP